MDSDPDMENVMVMVLDPLVHSLCISQPDVWPVHEVAFCA